MFPHEQVIIRRGRESGLPIIVAVHSTTRGMAIGGCRMKAYPGWQDGLADALRLSAAMTDKCALAGLPHGGGKTVIVLPPAGDGGRQLAPHQPGDDLREAALHDAGSVIEDLGGIYATGPDVGTGPADMVTIGERTTHVFCRPVEHGGSGDSSPATALGTIAALRAVCAHRFGSPDLSRRSFAVLGLGRVGAHVARLLAEAGAKIKVADIDEAKRAAAPEGSVWINPDECLRETVDVLIPAALGGLLGPETVPALHCRAIAGPANNQLVSPDTAATLHERGILWAPDAVVSAGGIIHATAVELRHRSEQNALAEVETIGDTLTAILREADARRISPYEASITRSIAARERRVSRR
ncbi:Glu/Leu/Phe/Val dehydrogenase dimerization domain-containing protein [Actinoplanes sp. CA-030573]|uniref:Glu/Leu/Phe/Val dehydrogenase family protein n=1 Tax=Actinoplanes sp. CA-030573 TaxID=3239898 RepID=UPI003D92F228